ncbi:uncharacterized protein LOC101854283 [Aplysia californica]|uniref:Uncharacterized protein LOC101854283 n=1 Tax=Aplysia californica TaxID=6500 RepID=A0ABM0K3H0_APLCA|nr:uncharacterized protein LOC101854283 [Aplysia californica]
MVGKKAVISKLYPPDNGTVLDSELMHAQEDFGSSSGIQVVTVNAQINDVQHQERLDEIIQANRLIKVRDVNEMLEISVGSAQYIIHDVLGYRKVCARWVPYMLSPELKLNRSQLKEYLKRKRYADDDEVQEDVRRWFRGKQHEFFADSMRQHIRRWRICIDKEGNYVEK